MGEERKSVRTKCFIPAEIIKLNGKNKLIERVSIQDFSSEGFKLVINLNLSPSSILESKIYVPEKNIKTSLLGEVVWNRFTGNKFEIGLKIKDMDEDTKAEILDWISPLREESSI
jgi:hypothetical protein